LNDNIHFNSPKQNIFWELLCCIKIKCRNSSLLAFSKFKVLMSGVVNGTVADKMSKCQSTIHLPRSSLLWILISFKLYLINHSFIIWFYIFFGVTIVYFNTNHLVYNISRRPTIIADRHGHPEELLLLRRDETISKLNV